MVSYEQFVWAKEFMGFDDAVDGQHLADLAPLVAEHGAAITDEFYAVLGRTEATAPVIEGRVDSLKKTHARYLGELVAGDYGEAYFESRKKVGEVHVMVGIKPHWVESVMNFIRSGLTALVVRHIDDPDEREAKSKAVLRICDLDLLVINFAYAEERLDRLTGFTGMSRKLIERVINLPPKKP